MLVAFIAESFERHELKLFASRLQDGSALLAELPGDIASAANTAHAFVVAVMARGLLDADFFALLLELRSRRSAEINAIQQRCLANDEHAGIVGPGVLLRGGRYKLEELIDHGGVASVWRATDRNHGTRVAIKVLRRDMRDYKIKRWQFIKGATHMAAISHARVARVIEPHFAEMGHDFCVLEYLQGRSLADAVRSRRLADLATIVAVILDIGDGLAALHPRIFHGDVSPKNIIVSDEGHAMLVDFDLAGDPDDLPMTRATGLPGTDPFASPEWRRRSTTIDARTDIFSLGMTLVYALYGGEGLPSGLNDSRVGGPGPFIEKHLTCDPAIKAVLARACAIDPSERHDTITDFCDALARATEPLLPPTHEPPPVLAPEPEAPAHEAPPRPPRPLDIPSFPSPGVAPPRPDTPRAPPLEALAVEAVPEPLASNPRHAMETTRRSSTLAWFLGIATLTTGLLVWQTLTPPRSGVTVLPTAPVEPPPKPDLAISAQLPPPTSGALPIPDSVVAETRAAIHDLGIAETDRVQKTLQQIVRDPRYTPEASSWARLALAELLFTRAVAHEIGAAFALEDASETAQQKSDQDRKDATDAMPGTPADPADAAALARLQTLEAFAADRPVPEPSLADADDELRAWIASTPLWRGEDQKPSPQRIPALQQVVDPSTMTQTLLGLALWRSGDIVAAKQQLQDIVTRVPDHPTANVMLAAIDRIELPAPKPAPLPEIKPKRLPKPTTPEPTLPTPPPVQQRGAVRDAFRKHLERIGQQCASERGGPPGEPDEVIHLDVTIRNDGQVTDVKVTGSAVGTDIGKCLHRKASALHLGKFEGADLKFSESVEV